MILYLPTTVTRYGGSLGLPDNVIKSQRYAPYSDHLFERVNEPDFKGAWMIRNEFTSNSVSPSTANLDPGTSDIVVYYLHGGGYFLGSPEAYTMFLVYLAEQITRGGRSVSVFALDYSLSPEVAFPTQLVQTRKAYDWMIRDKSAGGCGIDKKKVVVMGDSAGGHLSLSLLVDLWKPFRAEERGLTAAAKTVSGGDKQDLRPGLGVMLLSPWLSLYHVSDSFQRNALTDIICDRFLTRCANGFLGSENQGKIPREYAPWVEFLDVKSGIMWDEVLPEWVWLSAGKHEIFYDDCVRWVDDRKVDCEHRAGGQASGRIATELDLDEPHDYAWTQTLDIGPSKRFCGTRMEGRDEHLATKFGATDSIAAALLERWKVVSETLI